ncbi:MAG TPA: RNA polymerase sigma factor [Bacteroidota bacterium]|nr:RNA polymerase sigma factor [Bacteroidota bacterium]
MPLQNLHEILNRCTRGDTSAFRMLMEEYQSFAFAVAFRIVGNEEETRDLVQEAFIRIWRNINRYDPEVKFTTWMYSIVSNLCYDALRSDKRRQVVMMEHADLSNLASLSPDENPEMLYTNHELASIIDTLTCTLPPKQKIIFVLRDLQDLSIREVCDILGVSEGSVKTNLVYARRTIRQQLERFYAKRD